MAMKQLIATVTTILLLSSGCSTQDVPESREDISSVRDEIQEMLDSFYKSNQRSGDEEEGAPEVVDFSQRWYNIVGDTIEEVPETRAANGDFAITTTVTNTNGSIGFSMMCLQTKQMFISTTNGSISDTTFNKGLKEYVEDAPLIVKDMIQKPITKDYQLARVMAGDLLLCAIDHLIVTKWGQGTPYNDYGESCHCSSCNTTYHGGHRPIGCVTVAIGQAIAKCGRFTPTFYGSKGKALNVLAGKTKPTTAEEKNQVAHILGEIAINCGVKFGCDGSGAYTKSAYRYLQELGYGCTYAKGGLDLQKFRMNLKNGCPHIMAGTDVDGKGRHMWIVDGYKVENNYAYYWCNWGWDGRCNGWVMNDPYSAIDNNGNQCYRFSKKKEHIYINSK